MTNTLLVYLVLALICLLLIKKIVIRLRLSRAKHPSLRGHAKMSRRVAKLLPYFEYNEARFFNSDLAPEDIAAKRKAGLAALTQHANHTMSKTIAFSRNLQGAIADVNFTSAYRVPFPYRRFLPEQLKLGAICDRSQGVKVKDLDDNWYYDLSGSYGVNVFGYDFYKECMSKGIEKVRDLGPVLGSYHPIIADNVERIKAISGLDEVSFHMSGTEAVMQAVRLARYHTGRSHLVRFCGAYHGWWDGVQPGIGNRRDGRDIYTLADLSEASLKVLDTRKDIACVLINPMQALHPNADAPGDATLINSQRSGHFDRQQYRSWLLKLRELCTRRNIVLIFDEVFTGFRLAQGGAQEYFSIQADLVTYGKTLGGGFPVGAVCGSHRLMKRFKEQSPANISFARGTFNSHPYVMGAMNEFLQRIQSTEIQKVYRDADTIWHERVTRMNRRLQDENIPVHISHMHTVLSVQYSLPSRYNWMLQFYLRAQGLELSWTGSGRLIMSMAYSEEDFNQVIERFIKAALQMKAHGWWWQGAQLSNKAIKRLMLADLLKAKFPVLKKLWPAPHPTLPANHMKTKRGQPQ
ncbi:MAG: aminotransferase class III-fold pyridoxal phosphate-dependent enzyme [Bermanella sp.]